MAKHLAGNCGTKAERDRHKHMFKFGPYLFRMTAFLVLVAVACGALGAPLGRAFMANPALNGLILGVLGLGILYAFRQVFVLRHEAAWITAFRRNRETEGPQRTALDDMPAPRLLAPMATLLRGSDGSLRLSAISMRSLLDSIASRLDEARALSRYLIGLLIFLGLLGTFWGLLITINSVSGVIQGLDMGAGNVGDVFANLKAGLAAPLSGMGTAFSSSLFGLAGSLVLGFLDLQSGQAQNRFYNDLEEWLSGLTKLSSPSPVSGDGGGTVPDYLGALLEQTAEGLNGLQRTLARGEENRTAANTALIQLHERLATLTDQMRTEQSLLARLAEGQIELRPILARLAEAPTAKGTEPLDDATRGHIRNIEVYLARLLEEMSSGRAQSVDDIRAEIKILARTIAASDKSSGKTGT